MTLRPGLIALALHLSLLVYADDSPLRRDNPAQALVERAFAGEKLPDRGTLRFRVRIEGDNGDTLKATESKDLDYVDFSWAPGKKFRVDMVGKNGPIRTLVSDGKLIATGLHVWDARFAWDYESHSRDINFDLTLKLDDEMWAYSHLISFHLHPLSGFEQGRTFRQYADLFKMTVHKPDTAPLPGVTQIKIQYPGKLRLHEYIEIETAGDFVFQRSNQPPGSIEHGLAYVRSAPVQITGLGWFPKTCVVTPEPSASVPAVSYRWESELVADAQLKPVDDSMFYVKRTESDVILWPYGTRVNNIWYGIVDTIQDWWEGVSDGVLGD